jgi:hypothetical protein
VHNPGRASVLAVAALLLAGCGDDDDSTAAPAAATTSVVASPTPSSPPGTDETSSDKAGTLEDAQVLAAREGLPLLTPTQLPDGWTFQDAVYGTEGRGNWQLTVDDASGAEVAVRQALVDSPTSFYADITTLLGSSAEPSGTVDLGPLGTWPGYDGVRHPRRFAVGELDGTKVVIWADNAASLRPFAALLHPA